jgi:hypothetical protein
MAKAKTAAKTKLSQATSIAAPQTSVTKVTATSVDTVSTPPAKSTVTNVIDIPSESLQRFDLADLQQYTQEKVYANTASSDLHLFFVGRDDVHSILKHVLSRVSVSLYLNMFGYDDPELNEILIKISQDSTITMLVTLDKSQASGPHEKALIEEFESKDRSGFNTHVAIGQSATH